ncbi:regulatory protein GemA [Methylophaga nitratireducenticrescens]|uniref:regulatory protein GemA n=1 Tax=Methylophaga nitratireducenticrescens TaxID=754476 RepID=UPI000CDC679F|nr:regulatory protein GemA [Methylophaga nitratireducenticrescens]AUZ85806.1 GemA protein [Methylophaga nitratireducenticrescens]AUZ85874.1 GemA protein [Methylophaga nitratireducenticrescens]
MTNRAKLIQLVHIGTSKLFNDDVERRDWQQRSGGHRSCKDMSDQQLQHCVDLLKQAKVLNTKPPKRAGRVPFNPSPYMAKIEAMLTEMELSWQYAEAIAWRQTGGKGDKPHNRPGVQRLEWLKGSKHFESLIAALEKEQYKRRYLKAIELNLELLGLNESYCIDLLKQNNSYTSKWKRNLGLLKMLSEHLNEKYDEWRDYAAQ